MITWCLSFLEIYLAIPTTLHFQCFCIFCMYVLAEICTNNGDYRQQPAEGSNGIFIQYCSGGSWHYLCSGGVGWTPTLAAVACRQLGYSDQGIHFCSNNEYHTCIYDSQIQALMSGIFVIKNRHHQQY